MITAGGALTLALASLIAAQGSRAGGKRRKPTASPAAKSTTKSTTQPGEKRVNSTLPNPPAGGATAAERWGDPAGGGSAVNVDGQTPAAVVKPAKTKVYTFGAMDVEGKLKTPQLLYFLNRVKLELEMSAPDHRSFMKELEKTADDPNL